MANNDRTMDQSLGENAESAKGIAASYINERPGKDIMVSFSISHQGHEDMDDITSMDTMSNSDSKSRHTTFSAPIHHRSAASPSATTPSQSRSASPAPLQAALEADLCGIVGDRMSESTAETFKTQLPIRTPHQPGQAFTFNHSDFGLTSTTSSALDLHQAGMQSADGNEGGSTPRISSPSICSPNLSEVNRHAEKSPNSDRFIIYENHKMCEDPESSDDDLALERTADVALTQWFGISLSRLTRPIRVICAFEDVKEQCINILQGEGHCMDLKNDDSLGSGSMQDGHDDYCGAQSGSLQLPSGASKLGNSKRPNHEIDENEDEDETPNSGPGHHTKASRSKRKCHGFGDLSCPYRKRNPLRFNIRHHEACANKFYSDISKLKKHLTAEHFKPSYSCSRCQQQFRTTAELIPHIQGCLVPPQSSTQPPLADPEDGFDETVDIILRSRKGEDKINTWPATYQLLFKDDEIIPPEAFEPVYEHHEVAHKYKSKETAIHDKLFDLLTQQLPDKENGKVTVLSKKIMTLFQSEMVGLLRDSNYLRGEIRSPRISQGTPSSEDDFVELFGGENGEDGFSNVSPSFRTPEVSQHASPAIEALGIENEIQQRVDGRERPNAFIDQGCGPPPALGPEYPTMAETGAYLHQYEQLHELPQCVDPMSLSSYDSSQMGQSEPAQGMVYALNDLQGQFDIQDAGSSMQCLSSSTASEGFGQFSQNQDVVATNMTWNFGSSHRMR